MAGSIQNPTVSNLPQVTNEISALQSGGYDLSLLKYPNEVGTADVPSYITFNIYVPTSSSYEAQSASSQASVQSESQQNSDFLKAMAGKPQQLGGCTSVGTAVTASALKNLPSFADNAGSAGLLGGAVTTAASVAGGAVVAGATATVSQDLNITLKPALRRIKQSVSIYMPDTVQMQMQHDYNVVKATDAMGLLGKASAFGSTLSEAFKNPQSKGFFQQLGAAAKSLATSTLGKEALGTVAEAGGFVGNNFAALALRSAGAAVNPQVELLYNGTQNRSFMFTFRFNPRSAQESQVINTIIQVFKYFSSPGVQPNTYGRYFIIPGQFDITFNFGQAVNPFISKLSTCVLTNVTVDYNPSDHWATMVDGAPPEILLTLNFMEADIIYSNIMSSPDGKNPGRGF